MKTAIIYKSRHGATEKVAYMPAKRLTESGSDVRVIDLTKTKQPHISVYERIIIGGLAHVGMIQKEIKSYCETNSDILKTKILGLYIYCMVTDEKSAKRNSKAHTKETVHDIDPDAVKKFLKDIGI